MLIVVVGGGKVGYYLVRTLLEHHHQVSLIEKSSNRAHIIAQEFPVLVVNGDGTNLANLADAGVDRAGAVVAVTGKDEVNLLVCQLAKRKFTVPRVIARVNNPKNREIFKLLGVDHVVSSTSLIASLVEREVAQQSMRTLLTFHHGDMTLVELQLQARSPASRKAVKELAEKIPEGCVLVSVLRGDGVIIPKGDTVLLPGDSIMALTHTGGEAPLRRALLGKG